MIDITPELESLIAEKADWHQRHSVQLAAAIASDLLGRIEWDEDAGEDWALISTQMGTKVMIFMAGPLVVTTADAASRVMPAVGDAPVVAVPSLKALVLTCNAETLRGAFGDRAWNNPVLNAEHFSADELWFCTV